MDDAAFTSGAASMNRRILLDQLLTIRSLMGSKGNAENDDSRDVIKDLAKKGMTLKKEQLTALSTEFLLTVLLDLFLLRLLDEGATVSSDPQRLMDDAAAAKKKKAAKKKRYKRSKAAAKHKKTELMSWLSGGIISVIMMIASFSFITTPIVTLSLFQPSDGSGEGKAPPALPPSASKSLRQKDLKSKNEASTSPDIIISPLAAVVPPPVFAPIAVSNRRMNSDEMEASACLDAPNWKDAGGNGCDYYEEYDEEGCPDSDFWAGDMGQATTNCCFCGGGSTTCEDFRSKCQQYINVLDLGFDESGFVAPFCKEAESCSCEAADHDDKVVTHSWDETFGLYNECKCDFWSRLCVDTRVGEACDYAAEYCCGDYFYGEGYGFWYLNSPTCYCDFFNYAQDEFGHKLKPKALNISKEFENPCGQPWIGNSVDERISLEAIYNETNGQNWIKNGGWMKETVDHCEWHGISCDSDGYVTGIDLRDNNLAGQFPVYTRNEPESYWRLTKYGLANLYNLKTIDLADNKLTGTIEYPPLYNLHSLTHFDVSGNRLSGGMDALISPSLTYANFSNNLFTSMRRFEKYKGTFQTLRSCDMSNNAIQNEAIELFENIPPNIEQFFASNNQIYGILPMSLNNLPKLRQFNISSNALSGSLPLFADSFLSLQELDVSNQANVFAGSIPKDQKNGFIGSIPEDLWRLQSLKVLNLAGNTLAGTISPDIGKMAALEEFDLSNNLLSGQIPTQMGQLEGILRRLVLANNALIGTIPSQLGQLQGAAVLLTGNSFDDSSTAPLSLCIEEFDLASDTQLCPVERNALSDFYDATKGPEWTDDTNWLDEYESYCNWHGVTCDEDKNVTKLELANNGLSGRLRKSIGDLTSIKVLDLSDNDIKGSIPTEIGLLSELTYLRLSYNAFTGTAPRVLGKLTKLQLLHLQSNRITGMPIMTQLDMSKYNKSTFVTDCGVPSAFDETPECQNCTMCCNANDDCYPQEKTRVANFGYIKFAAVFFVVSIVLCCLVVLFSYFVGKRKNRGNALTMSAERRLEEDDKYALSRIGKDSVYSYFVTEKPVGWLAAFATLAIQVAILAFFVIASEANLQEDTIDIQFTWKCPRDSDVCKDKADLTKKGWFIFSLLMIAFLAKDMINGCKLIYHSSKVRHTLGARIRYFIGGMCLCSITLYALYVSTVYNSAIATSNTAIIANSVIVLFIMEIDEYIFSAVDAINEKWTEHAADKEVSEMKDEIARQRAQIESQQEEIDNQRKDLRMLREAVEKIQESQAVAVAARASNAFESQQEEIDKQRADLNTPCEAVEKMQESQEEDEDAVAIDSESADCEGNTGAKRVEQVDQITIPSGAEEQDLQELKAAAASSKTVSQCTAHE